MDRKSIGCSLSAAAALFVRFASLCDDKSPAAAETRTKEKCPLWRGLSEGCPRSLIHITVGRIVPRPSGEKGRMHAELAVNVSWQDA